MQSAYFRFHNKSEDVENLYFVGAGTHPGAGLPGVLTSAKVLDRIVPAPLQGLSDDRLQSSLQYSLKGIATIEGRSAEASIGG
jgi:hypothetical protein